MTTLHDVPTPAVVVDLDVLEANVARMAGLAREHGVALRPHVKTHKVLEIARMQLQAGAVGLTVAKPGEAEVFAGICDDLFVAYPVTGEQVARRLLALPERCRLSIGADSAEGVAPLGAAFDSAGRRLPVRLKVDVGFHRVGVAPERVVEVARAIAALPGIDLEGVFTHAGQAYAQESAEAVAEVGRHEGEALVAAAVTLREAGLEAGVVSVGSTPTARHAMAVAGVTECRPGNYVYHDGTQVGLGSCAAEDCAQTVLATVVSTPAPDRAVVDAGSKTLSSDPLRGADEGGFGQVLGGASRLVRLSEEHGVLAVAPGEGFRVGQRVRVLPNHSCVVSNLHDQVLAVRGERIEARWRVAARGRVS